MPSGSAPDRVNSSVWQMPVALISTRTSPPWALKVDLHDFQRLSGGDGNGGAGLHGMSSGSNQNYFSRIEAMMAG